MVDQPKTVKTICNGILNAISPSPGQKELVVIGGRDILKIYSTGTSVQEVYNLKGMSKSNLNYSSNDVKWGHGVMSNNIVSASSSGAILVFDLHKSSNDKLDRTIQEHNRAVHRICFHQADNWLLLSGSLDGTMKLWDLRTKGRSKLTFTGKAESVRDVQFNPKSMFEFASVFDNGSLQTWDIRNPTQFERKWSAHNGLALALDWDSSGTRIATAGRDKVVKIWDPKSERRKPMHSLQTIAAVSAIRWRPGYKNQFATCSLSHDNEIHIWDLERPFIPHISLAEHDNVATCIVWPDEQTLWSCSKDESFVQHNVGGGYHPLQALGQGAIAWNANGHIAFAMCESKSEKRDVHFGESLGSELDIGMHVEGLQSMDSFNSNTFDVSTFGFLAHFYVYDCGDVLGSCRINAKFARDVGLVDIADVWDMVSGLVSLKALEPVNLTEILNVNARHDPTSKVIRNLFNFLREDSAASKKEEEIVLESAVDGGLGGISAILSPKMLPKSVMFEHESTSDESDGEGGQVPVLLSSIGLNQRNMFEQSQIAIVSEEPEKDCGCERVVNVPPWNPHTLLLELCDRFAVAGNAQMNVYLYLVLRQQFDLTSLPVEQYMQAYIDQLHQLKMWAEAAKVVKICGIDGIKALNQENSTIATACYNCSTATSVTPKSIGSCDQCSAKAFTCSFCHMLVKGLYVWCHWCSHGGHLACLDSWFAEQQCCPSGCGHKCTF